MLNIEKVRALSKERGISMNFLCSKIGVNNHYFLDVAKKKIPVPNERIIAIADLLGTSPEYLCDKTDDPSPQQKKPAAISDELWRKINEDPDGLLILEMLYNLDEERRSELKAILAERFSK